MKYEEYSEKYENTDHILIRMTDYSPYFKEKMVVKNGIRRIDDDHCISYGLFSTYIGFEMPDDGIYAEISGHPRFEITWKYEYPVFITNVGEHSFEVSFCGKDVRGEIRPGEVLAICPDKLAEETFRQFERDFYKRKGISQDEINRLLGDGPGS